MAKPIKKALERLHARQNDYLKIPVDKRKGTKKPGSLNSHKSFSTK